VSNCHDRLHRKRGRIEKLKIMTTRLLALLAFAFSLSGADITSPPPGSPERKAILDALRPPLNKLAGRGVKFLRPNIKVADGWATVTSEFEADDGRELPEDFQFDYFGLAERVNGKWVVRSWGFAGDVSAVLDARMGYPGAPAGLFPAWANKMAADEKAKDRAAGITTPKIGSPERKGIMDALRGPVQARLKKNVIFRVGTLRVGEGWAFLQGNALRPDGTELGDEDLWGELTALLRKRDGKWTVAHWGLATDTSVMDEAVEKFPDLPNGLIPGFAQ
jgi:hypothetical protein